MAELTHDPAEDGFHEIQLSGKQLVFLFMLMTVVFVGIFLCGVLVGRSVEAQRAEAPVDATKPAAPAPTEIAETGPAATEPPAPPVEDELTYHSQLEGTPPKPGAKPQPQPQPPSAAPQPPAKSAAANEPKTAAAAGQKPASPAATPASRAADTSAGAPAVPTSGRPGRWVVQVSALRNRTAAAEVVQRLIGKGYPAFLVPPPAGAPQIYRVQIGRYGDRSEAEQVVRRLTREEQFSPEIKR